MRWSATLALAAAAGTHCTLDAWKIQCIGSAVVKDGRTCGQVQCVDGRPAFPEAVTCADGQLRTLDGRSVAGFVCAEDGHVDHDAVPLRAARRLTLHTLWDGPSGWRDARGWAGRYEAPCGLPTNLSFTVEVSGAGIEEVMLTRKDSLVPVSVGSLEWAPNGTGVVAHLVAPDAGEFEVRARDGRGVVHSFRSTRFRIGSPWGCNEQYDLAAVVLGLHGAPTLTGFDRYLHLKRRLVGARVPVRVVLPIFVGERQWTTSASGTCELDGRYCEPDHAECSAEYCEMDRWRFLMQGLLASSPGNVTVLGLVNLGPSEDAQALRSEEDLAADILSYMALGVSGFYFAGHDGSGGLGLEALEQVLAVRGRHVPPGAFVAVELREPIFHPALLAHAHRPDLWVTAAAPAEQLGPWAPYAWYASEPPQRWGAALHGIAEPLASGLGHALDRGYGTVVIPPDATESVGDVVRALTWKSGLQGPRRLDMGPFAFNRIEWGCDDTMDSCHPVCLLRYRYGAVRTAQEACAGQPKRCSCRCFDAPQWSCINTTKNASAPHCTAMRSDKVRQVVGDLVCAAHEPPKPCTAARRLPVPTCPAAEAANPWAAYLRANQRPDLHLELEDISGDRAADSAAGWLSLAFAAILADL